VSFQNLVLPKFITRTGYCPVCNGRAGSHWGGCAVWEATRYLQGVNEQRENEKEWVISRNHDEEDNA